MGIQPVVRILLAAAFALAALTAHADFTGRVVAVGDGDTVTVLDSQHQQHKIRLAGIDAPERGQSFGYRSKEYLAKWVYDRDVVVERSKQDRYGRLVGKEFVEGHDAGLEQIRAGLAWWNRAYAKEQSPEDRGVYKLAETAAREQKLRLWRDPNRSPNALPRTGHSRE